MRNRVRPWRGPCLWATLTAALLGVALLAPAHAQAPGYRPPAPGYTPPQPGGFNPNPQPPGFNPNAPRTQPQPFQPPAPTSTTVTETVWSCQKCGHVVGYGPTKPSISSCPKCGTSGGSSSGPRRLIGCGIAALVALVVGVLRRASR